MSSIKKILLPTDLSENSVHGLIMAFPLAAEKGAVLIVLHVADPRQAEGFLDTDLTLGGVSPRWTVDRIIKEASLDLHSFIDHHRDLVRFPFVRKKVLFGDVSQRIIEEARREAVDLVIMAPCPHRRLKRFFFEGITDRIIREAPCPVLLVSRAIQRGRWWGNLIPSLRLLLRHAETTL